MEGFPFVLVEGMCAGAIPISTTVGTITEFIRHGENGLLFPQGDSAALAQNMNRLLDEPELCEAIRLAIRPMREEYDYKTIAAHWSRWLGALWPKPAP
jgi:glycosyltransferase involved in cell wall biosynthesis